MDAFTAKTPAQRATVALELAARSTSGDLWRSFDNCFEMNDGDAVIAAGLKKLEKSERYRAGIRRCRGVPTVWREFVTRFDAIQADRSKPKVWASYYETRWGDRGITLHQSEADAYDANTELVNSDITDEDRALIDAMFENPNALADWKERFYGYLESTGHELLVEEVELPEHK